MLTNRVAMYCLHCGSSAVARDATASWDTHKQAWVLADVMDEAFCRQCGGQSTLGEAPLKPIDE